MVKQPPLQFRAAHRSDVRSQFGAVCYRVKNGKTQILLITSRRTRRWIVPKGWPMQKMTPADSALREAWEEAGVRGTAHPEGIGLYSYSKARGQRAGMPCIVLLYAVRVTSLEKDYPERRERRRKWFSPRKAAGRVAERELARLLREFDPRSLG